jgi:hypothetical protein
MSELLNSFRSTLDPMSLLQDDEAWLSSMQRSQPTAVEVNGFPTHSTSQYELSRTFTALQGLYPSLADRSFGLDDDLQIVGETQSQIGMVRGSGMASLVVHLKYRHRGIGGDIQRILSTQPHPVKGLWRSEAVNNQSGEELSSGNESDMDVSKETHTGDPKAFSSEMTNMNIDTHSVEPRAVIWESTEGVAEGVKGLGDRLKERFRQREKREVLDTSTMISRDSGYVSRMSSSTGAPANYLPEDWDLGSVISLESRATDVTMSSINPTALGGAAEEVVEVLVKRVEVRDLIVKGFQTMDIDRFERNFRRLLKEFAINLRKEAQNETQKSATKLVHDYRAYVTRIIRGKFAIDHSHTQAEALHDIQKQQASKVMLERLLCNVAETSEPRTEEAAIESDYGSGFSDDEQAALPNLEKVKGFMMLSVAFFELERRLREFVNPKPSFAVLVEELRDSDDASKPPQGDEQKQILASAEQLSTVKPSAPTVSILDVNVVCEETPRSPTDVFYSMELSPPRMSVSTNLEAQTNGEPYGDHKDEEDSRKIIPLKRTWGPNEENSLPSKRRNTTGPSPEPFRAVNSSIKSVPSDIVSVDEDIDMEDSFYVPKPTGVKPRGASAAGKSIKRSMHTPDMRGQATADAAALALSAQKRRNKLGYHKSSVACGKHSLNILAESRLSSIYKFVDL